MPFFSIVIPTRNRASLLRFAVQSVLSQGFKDFEVVISDNSSTDSTRSVVENLREPQVRYVRTDRPLLLCDHWEFARSHARGQYLLTLSDDDALGEGALDLVARALERFSADILVGIVVVYYDRRYPGMERLRGSLAPFPHTGKIRPVESGEYIRSWFRLAPSFQQHSSSTFFSKAVVSRVEQATGRFYHHPCPDILSLLLGMALEFPTVYASVPLAAAGRTPGTSSTHINHTYSGEADLGTAWDSLDLGLSHAPLKFLSTTNFTVETLLRLKTLLPEPFQSQSLDEAGYLDGLVADLSHRAELVGDAPQWGAAILQYLASFPQKREAVSRIMAIPPPGHLATWRWATRKGSGPLDLNAQFLAQRILGAKLAGSSDGPTLLGRLFSLGTRLLRTELGGAVTQLVTGYTSLYGAYRPPVRYPTILHAAMALGPAVRRAAEILCPGMPDQRKGTTCAAPPAP